MIRTKILVKYIKQMKVKNLYKLILEPSIYQSQVIGNYSNYNPNNISNSMVTDYSSRYRTYNKSPFPRK